jgi:hypothetical protein
MGQLKPAHFAELCRGMYLFAFDVESGNQSLLGSLFLPPATH